MRRRRRPEEGRRGRRRTPKTPDVGHADRRAKDGGHARTRHGPEGGSRRDGPQLGRRGHRRGGPGRPGPRAPTPALVGAVTLSGPLRSAHPHTFALVASAVRMAENLLEQEHREELSALATRATAGPGDAGGHIVVDDAGGWVLRPLTDRPRCTRSPRPTTSPEGPGREGGAPRRHPGRPGRGGPRVGIGEIARPWPPDARREHGREPRSSSTPEPSRASLSGRRRRRGGRRGRVRCAGRRPRARDPRARRRTPRPATGARAPERRSAGRGRAWPP